MRVWRDNYVDICGLFFGVQYLNVNILVVTVLLQDNIAIAEKLISCFENPADLIRTKDDEWWGPDRKAADCEMGEAIQHCMEHMLTAFR